MKNFLKKYSYEKCIIVFKHNVQVKWQSMYKLIWCNIDNAWMLKIYMYKWKPDLIQIKPYKTETLIVVVYINYIDKN